MDFVIVWNEVYTKQENISSVSQKPCFTFLHQRAFILYIFLPPPVFLFILQKKNKIKPQLKKKINKFLCRFK